EGRHGTLCMDLIRVFLKCYKPPSLREPGVVFTINGNNTFGAECGSFRPRERSCCRPSGSAADCGAESWVCPTPAARSVRTVPDWNTFHPFGGIRCRCDARRRPGLVNSLAHPVVRAR